METRPTLEEFCSFDTYIFDCDGVLWGIKDEDSQTSVATVNYLIGQGKRIMFVTNNSNKRRLDFVTELEKRGINFGAGKTEQEKLDMMISASYTTACYLKEHQLRRPFVITSDTGILEELREAGVTEYFATIDEKGDTAPEFESPMLQGVSPSVPEIIEAHPDVDCIVMGWDMGLTARKVGTAINYVKWHEELNRRSEGFKPMPIIACSGDAGGVLGTADFKGSQMKIRAIGNGAMADIVARSFDPPQVWLDMGKPSDALLGLLTSVYKIDLRRTLMVGDTVQTDIVFGNRGGMKTLLVLTGVTTREELEQVVLPGHDVLRHPTFVLERLGEFCERGELGGDPTGAASGA